MKIDMTIVDHWGKRNGKEFEIRLEGGDNFLFAFYSDDSRRI